MALMTPGGLYVQVIFQDHDGLSKDRYVNGFHFLTSALTHATTADADAAIAQIEDFYNTNGAGGHSVGEYIGSHVLRPFEMRAYDMNAPTPRPQLVNGTSTLPASSGQFAMPSETACCLTTVADRNIPRHRGRIYVGPLSLAADDEGSTNLPSRPTTPFKTALTDAATRMIAAGLASVAASVVRQWAVFSRHDNLLRAILGGWVDDSWDSVGRRKTLPTARTTF